MGRDELRCTPRGWLNWLTRVVALFIPTISGIAAAQDMGSTNTTEVLHFWNAVDYSNRPVTVVALGDSVQDPYRSLGRWTFSQMSGLLGRAGIAFSGQEPNLALSTIEGGTYVQVADTNWWMDYLVIPPGGSVWWTNATHATGSLLADRIGLYYLATPAAGSMSLSVSSNGGPWIPVLSLDASSLSLEGRYTNVSVALGYYRMRVDGLTGTNRVLGPELVNTTSNGIVTAYLAKDGMNLNAMFSVPASVLDPILSNLHPDFLIWHMKEWGDFLDLYTNNAAAAQVGLSNRVQDLERWWQAAMPDGDVVYIGTPYEAADTNGEYTIIQNRIIRAAAVRDGRCYVDCMTPMQSYSNMVAQGYLDDAVHPSNTCYTNLAQLLWNELGFNGLRVPEVDGTYCGLLLEESQIQLPSSGSFTVSVTTKGKYTGRLRISSGNYAFTGVMNFQHRATNVIIPKNKSPLSLSLQIVNETDRQVDGYLTDGIWTARLQGKRMAFNSRTNPSPYAGTYTLLVPGFEENSAGPTGYGFGVTRISYSGRVNFVGTLADGTPFSQGTMLSQDGCWPLHAVLYSGKGLAISWLVFTNGANDDLSGLFCWIKSVDPGARYYPGGLTNESLAVGSAYLPHAGTNLLDLSGAQLEFSGGNLGSSFTNFVSIGSGSRVHNLSSNQLSMSFSLSSGTFKGKVTAPLGGRKLSFWGAVLPKPGVGGGFLLGINQCSRVVLVP